MGKTFTGKDTAEKLSSSIIKNDRFFPDLDLLEFKKRYRVDDTFKDELLSSKLISKIIQVNDELHKIKTEAIKNGIFELKDLTRAEIGGENVKLSLYKTGVYSSVRAELCQHLINYDYSVENSNRSANKVDSLRAEYSYYDKESRVSINKLLGRTFIRAKLV